jgi:hypothetical protein
MKRAVFCYLLVFICLAAGSAALSQTSGKAGKDTRKACPFSIVGLWRSEATTMHNPIFFNFSPEGWVVLLGHTPGALPQDFEMVNSANYKLDKPRAPKKIEFITGRGNEAFLPGITMLDITEYNDNSFTTSEPATGQQTRWIREQMHRYFLTFAARSGPLPHGGPAFATLTVLDGRAPRVDAIGIQVTKDEAGKTAPVFGKIPVEIYDQVREESEKEKEKKNNKEETVFLRFELTQSEFEAAQKVFQTWDKYLKDRALPHADPYLNGMEFSWKLAESLNQCGEKANLYRPAQSERDEIVSKYAPPQRLLEYIRVMRKKNDVMHVNDAVFPWQWRPMIQAPGQ